MVTARLMGGRGGRRREGLKLSVAMRNPLALPAERPAQKTGLSTMMTTDVQPTADGQSNRVTFRITPDMLPKIFAEKPEVHPLSPTKHSFLPLKDTHSQIRDAGETVAVAAAAYLLGGQSPPPFRLTVPRLAHFASISLALL